MDIAEAMEIGRNAFWIAMVSSAPIVIIGLLVGLTLSLFQAVTQLQEQTLSFAPKIMAMILAGMFFIPWITERMVAYTREMFSSFQG